MSEPTMLLHNPEVLRSLAKQLREEADRCEARAEGVEKGEIERKCDAGCWNSLTTCWVIEWA